jgi:hypothetical protein
MSKRNELMDLPEEEVALTLAKRKRRLKRSTGVLDKEIVQWGQELVRKAEEALRAKAGDRFDEVLAEAERKLGDS